MTSSDWAACRAGDLRARNRLIERYESLIGFAIHRTRRQREAMNVDVDDAWQYGVVGLIDAVNRYDPARGVKFITFAVPRITGAIRDGLRIEDWLPRTTRDRLNRETKAAVGQPVPNDVAPRLRRPLTINPLEAGNPDAAAGPDGIAVDVDDYAHLHAAVAALGERDRYIIHRHYVDRICQREIGLELGVTESRVCQLLRRIAGQLRRVDGLRQDG